MLRSTLLLLIAVPVTLLHAEDDSALNHLRLGVQSLPTKLDVKTSGFGGSRTDSVDADSAGRLSLGYWYGGGPEEVSFMIGGGLDLSSFTFKDSGETLDITQSGGFLDLGVAWRVVHWFTAEASVRLGAGLVRTESSVSGVEVDDTGYGEGSARVRGVFTIGQGLELLVETGLVHQQFTYEFDVLGETVKQRVTAQGAFAGAGIGWRF